MQLIDKAAVVAEIENLLDKGKYHEEFDCAYRDGNNGALYALKDKLDTLEVKEVDLEKEFNNFIESAEGVPRMWHSDEQIVWAKNIAKYFFDFGIRIRKEEIK